MHHWRRSNCNGLHSWAPSSRRACSNCLLCCSCLPWLLPASRRSFVSDTACRGLLCFSPPHILSSPSKQPPKCFPSPHPPTTPAITIAPHLAARHPELPRPHRGLDQGAASCLSLCGRLIFVINHPSSPPLGTHIPRREPRASRQHHITFCTLHYASDRPTTHLRRRLSTPLTSRKAPVPLRTTRHGWRMQLLLRRCVRPRTRLEPRTSLPGHHADEQLQARPAMASTSPYSPTARGKPSLISCDTSKTFVPHWPNFPRPSGPT